MEGANTLSSLALKISRYRDVSNDVNSAWQHKKEEHGLRLGALVEYHPPPVCVCGELERDRRAAVELAAKTRVFLLLFDRARHRRNDCAPGHLWRRLLPDVGMSSTQINCFLLPGFTLCLLHVTVKKTRWPHRRRVNDVKRETRKMRVSPSELR